MEMTFMCKKCKKAFRKEMSNYEESDEYCPHCDNHYVSVWDYEMDVRRFMFVSLHPGHWCKSSESRSCCWNWWYPKGLSVRLPITPCDFRSLNSDKYHPGWALAELFKKRGNGWGTGRSARRLSADIIYCSPVPSASLMRFSHSPCTSNSHNMRQKQPCSPTASNQFSWDLPSNRVTDRTTLLSLILILIVIANG